MEYSAIILIAGNSTRFNGDGRNKVFIDLNGQPIFIHSLEVFLKDFQCKDIIVVYNKKDEMEIEKYKHLYANKVHFTVGGNRRIESVINGLKLVYTEHVLVHDGARPFVSLDIINNILVSLKEYDSVSLGLPVTDTVKFYDEDKKILKTIDRNHLFFMQTPQGCKTSILLSSLNKAFNDDDITDDLVAIERYSNASIKIIVGSKKNIKITTKEDLVLAKYYGGLNV